MNMPGKRGSGSMAPQLRGLLVCGDWGGIELETLWSQKGEFHLLHIAIGENLYRPNHGLAQFRSYFYLFVLPYEH